MFDFINVAFGWLMKWCYILVEKLGFGGYALALLIFALICQILLFPFGIKQQKNSQKQASLRPKENIIRHRYNGRTDRNSQMKMNVRFRISIKRSTSAPSQAVFLSLSSFLFFSRFFTLSVSL